MATIEIRKKSASVWTHTPSDFEKFIQSRFRCKVVGDYFRVVEFGGRQLAEYHFSDVTVYDDTQGGGAETFSSGEELMLRLESLEYPAFTQGSGGGGIGFQPVVVNPQNGQTLIYSDGQWVNGYLDLNGNRFITVQEIPPIVNGEITLPEGFVWVINTNTYFNANDEVFEIEEATAGFYRTDIIVAQASETQPFVYIQGVESEDTAVPPTVPDNTLLVTSISVFGDQIGTPTSPIDGSEFIKKTSEQWASYVLTGVGGLPILPQINENNRNINITGNPSGLSSLGGFVASGGASIANFWDGMTAKVLNSSPNNQTIKHNYSEADIKYLFPNEEDYIIRPNEVVYFDLKGGNLVFRYSTFLNAKNVFFDNTGTGLDVNNLQKLGILLSTFNPQLSINRPYIQNYEQEIGDTLYTNSDDIRGITNDSNYYYISQINAIKKIDRTTNALVATMSNSVVDGANIHGLFYDNDSGKLLLATSLSGSRYIYEIDPDNMSYIDKHLITNPLGTLSVAKIGNKYYVGNYSDHPRVHDSSIRIYNSDFEFEKIAYQGIRGNYFDMTFDGTYLYVTSETEGVFKFEILDDDTLNPVGLYNLEENPSNLNTDCKGITWLNDSNFLREIDTNKVTEVVFTDIKKIQDGVLTVHGNDKPTEYVARFKDYLGNNILTVRNDGKVGINMFNHPPEYTLHIRNINNSNDRYVGLMVENTLGTTSNRSSAIGFKVSATRPGEEGIIELLYQNTNQRAMNFIIGRNIEGNQRNVLQLLSTGEVRFVNLTNDLIDSSTSTKVAITREWFYDKTTNFVESSELSEVAFSGSYDDLNDKPNLELIPINIFNQYTESTVSGDDGTNLIQPDLGLPVLEIDDLKEDSSYSGELVLKIENNNITTAKVIELFGAEIYNNTNPSSEINAKITFTLDFFNQVGDDVDYKLSWQYVASGEVLFGEYTGTIDSTNNHVFDLLATGDSTDNFTLKQANLIRITDSESRVFSGEAISYNLEVQKAIYNNVKLGNKIPQLNTIKAIDEFISNLKEAGVWSKFDIFSLFQMNDNTLADFALYDYKRDTFMTSYGGMIYDEFGYQGNGIDGYIDTEFNPSTDGDNYTLDDASRLFWISKNPTEAGQSYVDVSSNTPNSGNTNYFRIHVGTTRMFINQGTTLLSGGNVNSLGLGFKAIVRTSSTDVAVFNSTTKNARTATSTEINNAKQLLFTSGNGYSDMGLGFYAMGASLTDQDVEDIIDFYNEYLIEIGL